MRDKERRERKRKRERERERDCNRKPHYRMKENYNFTRVCDISGDDYSLSRMLDRSVWIEETRG